MPISTNTTWNACIRGYVTLPQIRSNPDKDERGRGYSCGHYYYRSLWTHPDLDMEFTFARSPLTIVLPQGYVLAPTSTVAAQ